jgi:hypothetical protein
MKYPPYPLRGILYRIEQVRANQNQEGDRVQYGPTFGNAESRLFLFAAQCFSNESIKKVILWHSCV